MKILMDAIIAVMICGVLSIAVFASGSSQISKGQALQVSIMDGPKLGFGHVK
ncbi:hypothetical protein HFN87_27810 [Rhizobium laguerreae]|uniref:hypothetical protein n=1 Tax=Rhizobium laguerreae TaxID=1076926 RepID=UPI001C907DCE|nr:hypothetical protein [Rhizobium laguerreae]MBY3417069.1 hypothetical protein [Rhizobium laguerreae]